MAGALVRGERDCLSQAAVISRSLFGRDPLSAGHPAYRTLTGALRILAAAGGWSAWADAAFRAAGMQGVDGDGLPGDLALVPHRRAETGLTFGVVIRPGEHVIKAASGLSVSRDRPAGVWTWA